jgi:sugar transferase (PEP-CTERM/EpsH1 system associated)
VTDLAETKPSLLFLTQRLPYPPIKGEKIRQYQILRHLAARFTIDLGCLIDDPADRPFVSAVQALCRSVHAPAIDRRCARIRCLSGLLTNEALSVTFFRHRGLRRWVEDIVTRTRPAVIVVISSNMAPYIIDLPHTGTRIVDLVDVDSEKWRAYAATARWPMSAVYRREWRKVSELEERIARECDHACFVSDAEAAILAARMPEHADRIVGISNGVDDAFFDPGIPQPSPYDAGGPVFVFTGTMDYPPNVDAVRWFADDILPRIRATIPTARFYIVGNHPTPSVRALSDITGVVVTGWVADVRPYLAHATVAVAPMRIARGIQNKVLEAMAMARPVVVTAGALEGIDAEPGRHVLLADDAGDFAAACVKLAGPDGAMIGSAARTLVVEAYDWAARLARLDALLSPPIDRSGPTRAAPVGPNASPAARTQT